jgi:hypothetical protein
MFREEISLLETLEDQVSPLSSCLHNYKDGRVLIARYLDVGESINEMSGER